MIKEKIYVLFIVLSGFILGGCTDNGLLFRSTGEYETSKSVGSYYIGEPYTIRGVLYTPAENEQYREKGAASWYRRDDAHRLTTNGEVFDSNEMTAAHKTLPLPSLVRITNLENGNVAIVRVNDRGPNVNNRLIDVSQKVAAALEFPATGTTMVEVEILAEESRRLKAEALGQAGEEIERVSKPEAINKSEEVIPLGSEQVVYQPDVSVMPLYEIPAADGSAAVAEKGTEVMLSNEPLDLVGDSFESAATEKISESVPEMKQANEASVEMVKAIVPSGYAVQLGAFGNAANVERAAVAAADFGTVIRMPREALTVIRIGPFESWEKAREVLDKVHRAGYGDAVIQVQK